jgi:hypothetical protein
LFDKVSTWALEPAARRGLHRQRGVARGAEDQHGLRLGLDDLRDQIPELGLVAWKAQVQHRLQPHLG